MLKMGCVYYKEPIRRTMASSGQPEYEPLAPWNQAHQETNERIAHQLTRIADTLERLLKISEMSL